MTLSTKHLVRDIAIETDLYEVKEHFDPALSKGYKNYFDVYVRKTGAFFGSDARPLINDSVITIDLVPYNVVDMGKWKEAS